jgi:hypothetical protein
MDVMATTRSLLLSISLLTNLTAFCAIPGIPELTLSLQNTRVEISRTEPARAEGYRLYFAPFPGVEVLAILTCTLPHQLRVIYPRAQDSI